MATLTHIIEGNQGRKAQNKTKINQNKITYILEGDQGRKTQKLYGGFYYTTILKGAEADLYTFRE